MIVVECKADQRKHDSKVEGSNRDKDFAVDDVLLYSAHLSKEFDVLSIAVSVEKKNDFESISFLQLKGGKSVEIFGNKLLSLTDLLGGI